MRWVGYGLAIVILALSASPAQAQGAATIKVTVRDFSDNLAKAQGGIVVFIRKWPKGEDSEGVNVVPTAPTDQGFTGSVTDSKLTPLPPDTYEISVRLTDNTVGTLSKHTTYATQIVHVGEGDKLDIVLDSSKAMTTGYEGGVAFENAATAKEHGNAEGYNEIAADIRNGIAQDERLVDEAQAAADAFARDNGLRVTNLAGAQKDLKNLNKLGQNADQEVKRDLESYVEKLKAVDKMRQDLDANKKRFAELEERKFSLLPSACPPGQGGGLLAGTLNTLFGTDLAGVCGDQAGTGMRRDTERHDRHDDHGSNR